MTDIEEKIWAAAYAAAFVSDFELIADHADQHEPGFETAIDTASAERAWDIASLAVAKYRAEFERR
jgi:hypothetical protein